MKNVFKQTEKERHHLFSEFYYLSGFGVDIESFKYISNQKST